MLAMKIRQTGIFTSLLAYRTAIHETTGFTPFHVFLGNLMLPFTSEGDYPEYIRKLKLTLQNAYQEIRQTMSNAHKKQKQQYDKEDT